MTIKLISMVVLLIFKKFCMQAKRIQQISAEKIVLLSYREISFPKLWEYLSSITFRTFRQKHCYCGEGDRSQQSPLSISHPEHSLLGAFPEWYPILFHICHEELWVKSKGRQIMNTDGKQIVSCWNLFAIKEKKALDSSNFSPQCPYHCSSVFYCIN